MQVVEDDGVGPKSLEAFLELSPESLRPTGAWVVTALGGDDGSFGNGASAAAIARSLSPRV
jgi:hypothetical protein